MSFTSTSTVDRTATVYLSPAKRRRHSPSPDPNAKKSSSIKDIYNWTFLATAIAPCSIRDALEMRENTLERREFFWLGSVPCSFVKIVGMIVGVQVYEKRILYSVDDGTGVIDCSHKSERHTLAYQSTELPPSLPKPIGKVGNFVKVTGRVQPMFNSRQIAVKDIELCSSANDELAHTRTVRQLHRTSYSRTEPFTIPPQTYQPGFNTPKKNNVPDTPSTMYSSPISSSIASSPVKSEQVEQAHRSPIKLRHPSRLHTHDLTENTFRIYLKHYMDHAPVFQYPYDSDIGIGHSISQAPSTPTKRSRFDKTPRQTSSRHEFDATPRARISAPDFGTAITSSSSTLIHASSESETDTTRSGFSLSYLRRVPELSLLASRVVEAVGRRKLREERHRMKEARVPPSRSQNSKMLSSLIIPPDKFAAKKKRLFQWAIIQLLKEGCIVHWDGPFRSCPDTSIMDASRLWKANITSTTLPSDNTLFSMTSGSISYPDNDVDDGSLSDPDPGEEAYISLTPEFLADFVERAITVLVDHYEKMGKPYSGATKEGILGVLRKDDRWQYVGEWNVDDTLDLLKREGRAWCMGKGRWDLTG